MREKKIDTFKWKILLVVVITIVASTALTYGFFVVNKRQTGQNEVVSGCFDVQLVDETASINLTNSYSMSDEDGKKTNPYSFGITNTCDIEATYYIVLDVKDGSFGSEHINVMVDGSDPRALNNYILNTSYPAESGYSSSYILKRGTLAKGEKDTFEVRAWINEAATYEDVSGKSFVAQVRVVNVVKEVDDELFPSFQTKIKKASNGTKDSFASTATTDEGIFEMEDDYGTSYYYRGAVEDNYVKFGQNKTGQDMYWRIIRLNGDGSLRIIYDGTSAHVNGEESTDRAAMTNVSWNTNDNDAKYIGYMFGGENGVASTSKDQAQTNETSSNIKTELEKWYKDNIVDTGYSNTVSDEIFCNDRSFADDNTGTGFGTSTTYYAAYGRVGPGVSNPQPSFKCPEKNDSFTMSDTIKGNGALEYPVGLITADEIVAAGGKWDTVNTNYYLYKGTGYWSLSPYIYDSRAYVFVVHRYGRLFNYYMYGNVVVAPVVNLSAEYANTLIGEGTMTDPYRAPGVEP